MDKFIYKKSAGITALSASITDFTYKKHSHKEYAIGVTLRGIQEYNLDGSLQLSHQNGVMFFNPEQAHDGMAHDKAGLDYIMLYIEPQLLLEVIEKKDIVRFSTPIVYDYRIEQRVLSLTNAILREKDEPLCSELLLSLTDSLIQTNLSTDGKKDNTLIRKAKDMLHTNIENVLKLDDICKDLHLSKFQFIRLFKAHTGISPYQYYLNYKIETAKQLIEKNKDIYSAVAECGFVDLTHLNKHFKSVYGTTALEYMSHKLEPRERLDKGDDWNGSVLSMYLHAGTHVDAPWHHMNNGKGIDAVPIEDFIYRKPLLIDCPLGQNGFITIEKLEEYEELNEADILIFNTGHWKHRDTDFEKYANNFS